MDRRRKNLRHYEFPNHLRFLTYSCYHRLPLFQNEAIKDAYSRHVDASRDKLRFRLIAWVIMPEHVHLLIWPGLGDTSISTIVWHLKRDFARSVIARWRELDAAVLGRVTDEDGPHFWQHSAGYDRNVFSQSELDEKVAYIHSNPVLRGLVRQPTDWKWSSARWYADARADTLTIDSIVAP